MRKPSLKSLFDEVNKTYFNDEIPRITLRWDRSLTTTGGRCHYIYDGYPHCCYRPTKIVLNEFLFESLEWDRESMLYIMLHEMTHAFLIIKHDDWTHRSRFQKLMKKFTGLNYSHTYHYLDTSGVNSIKATKRGDL